jgi:hypothetical protein
MTVISWVTSHWSQIAEAIASIIGTASIFIKLFPVLDKNHWFLPFVKFIGKYIALNNVVVDADRPAA